MKVSDGLCFIRTAIECLVDPNTQKETAEALGFVYVTFVDDNTLTNSQNEATFLEGIRSSQKIFKDLIADIEDWYISLFNGVRFECQQPQPADAAYLAAFIHLN